MGKWKALMQMLKRETFGWVIAVLLAAVFLTGAIDLVQIIVLVDHDHRLRRFEQIQQHYHGSSYDPDKVTIM